MRKSLLLVVLLIVSQVGAVMAQSLFEAPDTVCVRQPIQLKSNVPDKQSHYWGFCSGYLYNTPTGINYGTAVTLDDPSAVEVGKNDDGKYYGFVMNQGSGGPGDQEFVRLDYGTSLNNVPTLTSFGNMDGILPQEVSSVHLVRDLVDSNWYLFFTAGNTIGNSNIGRIDFGRSLANTPNIVTFGNLENKFAAPTGIFVLKDENTKNWHAFVLNRLSAQMKRLDMGDNISLTPTVTDMNVAPGFLAGPVDFYPILDNGKWYFFILNADINTLVRVDMGTLTNVNPPNPPFIVTNGLGVALSGPSAITMIRDCGRIHAFVTNRTSHDIVRIEMNDIEGPYTATNFNNLGNTSISPTSLTRFIRDRDDVSAFITNGGNNTLTQVKFGQCSRTDIKYSLTNRPPEYKYDTAGLYNVYYAVNEGLPDMQVECKQIQAMPIPAIFLTKDTAICQGDTAVLQVLSVNALSYSWTPNYNISNTSKNLVKVWPEYTVDYHVKMPFPIGTCVVDTFVKVSVTKIAADAGPDRVIADGASTTIGGPNTAEGRQYIKVWSPNQYINDIYSDNPVVTPPNDFTYYLTVIDSNRVTQCQSIDTVVVYVRCEDVNLPNAFMPESDGSRAQFGLMNNQFIKLAHFDIYDRWGKQVFTTTDPTHKWDGTINGEKAAVGVYVWDVDGFCSSGKRIRKTGNVMLIR